MKPNLRSTALLIMFASVLFPISSFGEIIASGTLTDKSGDSDGEDLISATVTVDDKSMVSFEVRFTKSSFLSGKSTALFLLDLDKNIKTGFRGVNHVNDDADLIGVDAMISLSHSDTVIQKWDREGKETTIPKIRYSVTALEDGYSVMIPLVDLEIKEPTMNFTVTANRLISANSSSRIFDEMSDTKAPVGTVTLIPRGPIARMWTDAASGRTLQGILQSKTPDGSEVQIKRKDNGSVVTLKTERLIEADREFIKTWKP